MDWYVRVDCRDYCIYTVLFLNSFQTNHIIILNDANYCIHIDIGSVGPLGALCGALLATIPIKFIGVRATVSYCALPAFILSWILIMLSSSVQLVLVARLIGKEKPSIFHSENTVMQLF